MTDADSLFADILDMFPDGFFPQRGRQRALKGLAKVDWRTLSSWSRWCSQRRPGEAMGRPDVEALHSRMSLYPATGRQRNVAGAKHTATTRLPRDLSEVDHLEQALHLPHPYNLDYDLEADASFAVDVCARLGPLAPAWRNKVLASIRRVATSLAPLDRWALNHRPTRHCPGWAPVLTAAFVHLLRWEDRDLPWALVAGFQVVGAIPPSRVHRVLDEDAKDNNELREGLLGQSAMDFVDGLEADQRIHQHADGILEATLGEIDFGLARPLESRAEVDAVFGRGRWRPLPRHLVFQDDKARPIDDAKAGGHNASSHCVETIVCVSGEWPAVTMRALLKRIASLTSDPHIPSWVQPRTGTEDMWKGFRQNHPTKDDERFCVITFVHPDSGKRVYSRLRGLPFGMGSVVNQFNRLPLLKTAVLRRLFGLLACHYFDDELLMEMAGHTRSSATVIKSVANLWGIRYSANKSQPLSTWTAFLGHQYDWASFVSTSSVAFWGESEYQEQDRGHDPEDPPRPEAYAGQRFETTRFAHLA